jgi:uncharacterized protein YdaU (DUF1376 family)
MSKAPAMPMYWDAYLGDTTHLTTEEHGAYLLLLAAMWRRDGSVPDDDKDNARIIGLTPAKWRKIKVRLVNTIPGFYVSGGVVSQKNLQKIWKNTQEKIAKNRENGAKGGRPVSNENKDMAKANGYVSDNPNQSIPDPDPEPEPVITSPYGDGANAPQDSDSVKTGRTDKDRIFALVSQLVVMTGDRESAVRSRIGLLRKSNDDAAILAALVAGIEGGVAHPLDYATRILSDEKTKSDYGNPEYWEKHFANQ